MMERRAFENSETHRGDFGSLLSTVGCWTEARARGCELLYVADATDVL